MRRFPIYPTVTAAIWSSRVEVADVVVPVELGKRGVGGAWSRHRLALGSALSSTASASAAKLLFERIEASRPSSAEPQPQGYGTRGHGWTLRAALGDGATASVMGPACATRLRSRQGTYRESGCTSLSTGETGPTLLASAGSHAIACSEWTWRVLHRWDRGGGPGPWIATQFSPIEARLRRRRSQPFDPTDEGSPHPTCEI